MQRRLPSISSARFSSGGPRVSFFFFSAVVVVVVVSVVAVVVAVSAQLHPAKGPCGVGKRGSGTHGVGVGGMGWRTRRREGDGRQGRQVSRMQSAGGKEEEGKIKKRGGKFFKILPQSPPFV